MCSRSILTLIKLQRKTFLWTWELGPDGKRSIFPQWKLDSYCLKLAQDILVRFSLHYNISFGHDFELSEITRMLQFLFGKSSENPYSLIWVTSLMAVNTHGTLSPHTFSHWMVQSVPGVFRKLWKCPQTCFCEPSNLSLLAIEVFFFFPLWKLQSQSARKTYWLIFIFFTATTFLMLLSLVGKQAVTHFFS